MKNARCFAVGGVLLLGASLTGVAFAKAMASEATRPGKSISATIFQHCDLHTEDSVPAPESRPDVNVPAITGAQTVNMSHGADTWIALG